MEEVWAIEEVDFNIKGLSMDCFLPPADLKREDHDQTCGGLVTTTTTSTTNARLPFIIQSASSRISASKVAALDLDDHENINGTDDDYYDYDEEL